MAVDKDKLRRRVASKLLPYPDIDIRRVYRLQRALQSIKSSTAFVKPYKMWDHPVLADGRKIFTRVYSPEKIKRSELILFFHGGGWVTETVDTYNKVCVNLADMTGCRVMSVEYRLAPEFRYPCGLEDCYAVTRELFLSPQLVGVRAENIVLAGDSAGGNFAAAVSLLARDRGEFRVARQILLYPVLYNNHTETSPFRSVQDNATGYILTSKLIVGYMELYVESKEQLSSPYVAPLLAESLEGMPETLVLTAEYDPLRDEGEEYARRLKALGIRAEAYRLNDAMHGFIALDMKYRNTRRAFRLINRFLDA